jgi:hypothetical protein
MPGSTPIYGFPYPDPSDLVANYPALGQDLAEDVETVISGLGSGLNIVAPTTIANSGGTANASGGEITFTTVTSLSLNGIFSATYDNYLIVIDYTATANGQLKARMRAAGTDNSGANTYIDQVLQANNATLTAGRTTANIFDDFFMIRTENRQASALNLYAPFLAQFTQYAQLQHFSVSEAGIALSAGVHKVASSFDGLTLSPGSGSVTGKLRVYGYDNS